MIIYNEIEPNAVAWMQNLINAGEIPQGKIDARSIKSLTGTDLAGLRQFHTFAGIGGWPLALQLAGWPEAWEVWTGSCPCQPFSSAGKGGGEADARHLWPDFLRLITERLPATVFGEQVASKAGRQWVTRVRLDLEALGYRVGVADLCSAGVGAPHIRQRLYWVADLDGGRLEGLGQPQLARLEGEGRPELDGREPQGRLAHGERGQHEGGLRRPPPPPQAPEVGASADLAGRGADGFWSDYRVVPCTDGKARRTGTRVFPLAYGLPRSMGALGPKSSGLAEVAGLSQPSIRQASRARIGMLKGSGNAIVPELAALFIRAYMETL